MGARNGDNSRYLIDLTALLVKRMGTQPGVPFMIPVFIPALAGYQSPGPAHYLDNAGAAFRSATIFLAFSANARARGSRSSALMT